MFGYEMKIVPVKMIRSVSQGSVESEDLLQKPSAPPFKPEKMPARPSGTIAFQNEKLIMGGLEVAQMIADAAKNNPQFLSKIAREIEKFKKECIQFAKHLNKNGKLGQKEMKDLNALYTLCENHIAKIGEVLKGCYDETRSGLKVNFDDDGQLILNGMNINMFIESCRDNPTPKAKLFLKGIRGRLGHVLENKANARNFERVQDVILKLLDEIDVLLKTPTAAC